MLVLSRKKDEKIYITLPSGEEIILTLVDIRLHSSRIGIDAPLDCRILREELIKLEANEILN